MRDAAGELAERLQALAMFERFLGCLPLLGLKMKVAGAAQGKP